MDVLCGGDKVQKMAFILRSLDTDFPGISLCRLKDPGQLRIACLSLMRQLSLSKINWIDLTMWLKDLFLLKLPSWPTLRLARLACCPPVVSQGERGHSSGLQEVLNHTVERFGLRADIRPFLEDGQQLILTVGTGWLGFFHKLSCLYSLYSPISQCIMTSM